MRQPIIITKVDYGAAGWKTIQWFVVIQLPEVLI